MDRQGQRWGLVLPHQKNACSDLGGVPTASQIAAVDSCFGCQTGWRVLVCVCLFVDLLVYMLTCMSVLTFA